MDFSDISLAKLLVSLIGVVFLAVIMGSCLMWVRAIVTLWQGKPLLAFEPRRRVPWGLFDLLLVFLVMLFVVAAMQWVVAGVSSGAADGAAAQQPTAPTALAILASSMAMLLGCAGAVLVLRVRTGATWADLGFRARDFVRDVRIGGGAFLLLAPPMYALQFVLTKLWFESEHPVQTMLLDNPSAAVLLTAVFTAVVVAPLTEEMFFRVIFQGWLENLGALFLQIWRRRGRLDIESARSIDQHIRAVMIGAQVNETPLDALSEPLENDGPIHSSAAPSKPIVASNLNDAELGDFDLPGLLACMFCPRYLVWFRVGDVPGLLAAFLPIAISAQVFALLHATHGPDPIALLFLAIGLGYVYQRTHRATPCIVVHFLVNGLSTLALVAHLLGGGEPPA